jgi:predicted Zn-dependent protease
MGQDSQRVKKVLRADQTGRQKPPRTAREAHGRTAHFLAPAVIVAMVVAVAWIVFTSSRGSPGPMRPATAVARASRHHFWIVRQGQTLSAIAARTSVSISQLHRLNAGRDINTLRPGQFVRVRN